MVPRRLIIPIQSGHTSCQCSADHPTLQLTEENDRETVRFSSLGLEANARLLAVPIQSAPLQCEAITQTADARTWYAGQNPGMRVALLSSSGHRLTLVAWEPDTRTRDHGHRNGEEILVLTGELRSHDQRYPVGTWIRLHPGARHEPFAELPTVIMLCNGHLQATPSTRP